VKHLVLEVEAGESGRTLQSLLHDRGGFSHDFARGLIDAGAVRPAPGRAPVRSGDYARRVRPGETYEVTYEADRRYRATPSERPGRGYRVVHRDDDLLIVDKAPDLLSVPSRLREEESLAEMLLASERGRGDRRAAIHPVHRLDRDTSGLLVFARNGEAMTGLRDQFAGRSVDRRYLAVAEGRIEATEGRFVSRVVEDPKTLKVRSTRRPAEGREAITHYQVTDRLPEATIVAVRLGTGRKNQIRVHFSEAGHPLIGDHRYGHRSPLIRRAALHAASLGFAHPRTGRRLSFQSPLPPDMRDLIRKLRARPA
jgi:23S rRNA pseudouridine1911/1915/1917 synthase